MKAISATDQFSKMSFLTNEFLNDLILRIKIVRTFSGGINQQPLSNNCNLMRSNGSRLPSPAHKRWRNRFFIRKELKMIFKIR